MPLHPDTDVRMLDELHRHRQFHVGQINSWNVSASIAAVAALFAVVVGGDIKPMPSLSVGIWVFVPVIMGGFALFTATVFHWWHHADAIRALDALIRAELSPTPAPAPTTPANPANPTTPAALAAVVNGLGKDWYPAYPLVGAGVVMLLVGAAIYLWNGLMP